MSVEAIVRGMSREEKLAAMELIWQDLPREPQSFVSPEWHQTVVADRLENPAAGESLPLTEAKAEVKEAIHARRASG